MDKDLLIKIKKEFKEDQIELVINELSSIGLNHVMAESEYNLKNTRHSILQLAKGNTNEIIALTKKAKVDFRDVIMWAGLEKKQN